VNIYTVQLSKNAKKDLKTLPQHVVVKLFGWIDNVKNHGIQLTRKIPGYHDEPLHGDRQGQRSIRLTKAYRAIYEIDNSGDIHFIEIVGVNKHDY
jgi:proteic killer suppression protein